VIRTRRTNRGRPLKVAEQGPGEGEVLSRPTRPGKRKAASNPVAMFPLQPLGKRLLAGQMSAAEMRSAGPNELRRHKAYYEKFLSRARAEGRCHNLETWYVDLNHLDAQLPNQIEFAEALNIRSAAKFFTTGSETECISQSQRAAQGIKPFRPSKSHFRMQESAAFVRLPQLEAKEYAAWHTSRRSVCTFVRGR
jgi:hypothetical protein